MLHLLSHFVLGYQPDVAQAVYNAGQAVASAWSSFTQAVSDSWNASCPCL